MKPILPLFYHPTNVLLLDDDQTFLNQLLQKADESFAYARETDPNKALHYLSSHVYDPQELSKSIVQQNFNIPEPDKLKQNIETYDFYIDAVRGDLSLPDRFKKIVVGVIDRYMPAMDGLKFCEMLRKEYRLPIKLVLLTGATTQEEAIDAFNKGVIDAYMEKRNPKEMIPKLDKIVRSLAEQQFCELSEQMLGFISHQFPHIQDPQYIEQFEKIREEENTVEYYLYDSSGSFLLVDKKGNTKIFLVRVDSDFDMMFELAKNSGAFQDVLQSIQNRQQFPFYRSNKGYLTFEGEDWELALVQMSKIPGRNIFYSVIEMPKVEYMGFKQYIGQVWPRP